MHLVMRRVDIYVLARTAAVRIVLRGVCALRSWLASCDIILIQRKFGKFFVSPTLEKEYSYLLDDPGADI